MAKNVKLLLIENVDSLGIVGDVVNVRTGFARNFLLPRALATTPNDELVKSLAAKRADAEKMMAQQRKQREETTEKLKGVELELVRACNDQGVLYGAITQQEVATQLGTKGMVVKPRDVRLPGAIKRIDKYDIHIKMDSDLDAIIKLTVKPDRELPRDAGEPEAKPAGKAAEGQAEGKAGDGKPGEGKPERKDRDRGGAPDFEGRTERRDRREDREDRREKNMRRRADAIEHAIASDKARVVGWGVGKTDAGAAGAPAAPVAGEGEKKPKGKKAEGESKGGEGKAEAKAEKKSDKPEKGEKKSDKGEKAKK